MLTRGRGGGLNIFYRPNRKAWCTYYVFAADCIDFGKRIGLNMYHNNRSQTNPWHHKEKTPEHRQT